MIHIMTIKTKISFKQYVKLLYGLTYKKPIMIVILCVAFAMMTWITAYYLNFLPVPKPTYYQYLTLILITAVQPLVIFWTVKRNYESSSHLKEKLEIEFTDKEIKITGDSFYTELTWAKTYKVVELKDWFMIYQNTLSAILIPKKSFLLNQNEEFKQMLISNPAIDLHLKKD